MPQPRYIYTGPIFAIKFVTQTVTYRFYYLVGKGATRQLIREVSDLQSFSDMIAILQKLGYEVIEESL